MADEASIRPHSLILSGRAAKDLDALDKPDRLRVTEALRRFATDGRGDVKQLQGIDPPSYRLRIGSYRVLFGIGNQRTLPIDRVLHRKDAYR